MSSLGSSRSGGVFVLEVSARHLHLRSAFMVAVQQVGMQFHYRHSVPVLSLLVQFAVSQCCFVIQTISD